MSGFSVAVDRSHACCPARVASCFRGAACEQIVDRLQDLVLALQLFVETIRVVLEEHVQQRSYPFGCGSIAARSAVSGAALGTHRGDRWCSVVSSASHGCWLLTNQHGCDSVHRGSIHW